MSCYVGRIQRFTDENIESVIQKLMFLEDGGLVD